MTQHSKFSEAALKREDRSQKDLSIQLVDYSELVAFREPNPGEVPTIVAEDPAVYGGSRNLFKIVNQLEIVGYEKRIPDGILTKLRDTLIPKLISGEFFVPETEKLTEETLP